MQSETQCERTSFSDSSSEIEQDFSVDGLIVIPLKKKNVGKKTKRKSFREIKAEKYQMKSKKKPKKNELECKLPKPSIPKRRKVVKDSRILSKLN